MNTNSEAVQIPRQPTEAMMDAGLYHCSHDMTSADLETAWKAMFDTVLLDGGMTSSAPAAVGLVAAVEVAVILEGGLVQHVCTRGGPASVTVVDYDVEGTDEERLTAIPGGADGVQLALVSHPHLGPANAGNTFWQAVGAGERHSQATPDEGAAVAFARSIEEGWGEMYDDASRWENVSGRDAVQWLGNIVEDARQALAGNQPPTAPEGEGPAGLVIDALHAFGVSRAETFDGAEAGYFALADGREFQVVVTPIPAVKELSEAEWIAGVQRQEIADGAYGDGPLMHGAARDLIKTKEG